jgi:hypothetical protein
VGDARNIGTVTKRGSGISGVVTPIYGTGGAMASLSRGDDAASIAGFSYLLCIVLVWFNSK